MPTPFSRTWIDRFQDRMWREVGQRLERQYRVDITRLGAGSSISEATPWVDVCAALADGRTTSDGFRRLKAVRDIVETVGPVDGAHYAGYVAGVAPQWLDHPAVAEIDAWGKPIRCPGWILGTASAMSPTTLRYLATALWLQRVAGMETGCRIVEIGVGFGGLAAMNHLVSSATTVLVDLPEVAGAARRMHQETSLDAASTLPGADSGTTDWIISNYAFTELSATWQDRYIDSHLRHSRHGMILSNAELFSRNIGGRNDEALLDCLHRHGIRAWIDSENDLLSPGDHLCQVKIIRW